MTELQLIAGWNDVTWPESWPTVMASELCNPNEEILAATWFNPETQTYESYVTDLSLERDFPIYPGLFVQIYCNSAILLDFTPETPETPNPLASLLVAGVCFAAILGIAYWGTR